MGTISYLLSLLCFIAMLGHRGVDRDLLDLRSSSIDNRLSFFDHQINKSPDDQINQLLNIAKSQIGVREATGNNDGSAVERYLAYTGNKKGEAWCASFVSWVFGKAGYTAPRTAWTPSLFPKARLVKVAEPGTVFGIYFSSKKRIAHAGFVERKTGSWLYTIEGNTNVGGSREGDGVYRRLRHTRTIAAYANWLPKEKGGLP